MQKRQLKHPEGKKAISMESAKYAALKTSFTDCLTAKKTASFDELLLDVTEDLKNKKIVIQGVIKWNLFWVTLDMEANKELKKNTSVSPYIYSI